MSPKHLKFFSRDIGGFLHFSGDREGVTGEVRQKVAVNFLHYAELVWITLEIPSSFYVPISLKVYHKTTIC